MLFDELTIRDLTLRNRIVVSPMCQYSSTDGFATDWHLVHLGSRAVGGASLVFTEAAAVSAEGRISPQDLGIYEDEHIEQLARITRFLREQGSIPGIQLAHAGRKGSTVRPWEGNGAVPESKGGWKPVAPSAIPFSEAYAKPVALDENGIRGVVKSFANAAQRALEAGFQVIEIHSAHGYLLHEFLSPISNKRTDSYGGSLENGCRLLCEVVAAVRGVWPAGYPLLVRISATDCCSLANFCASLIGRSKLPATSALRFRGPCNIFALHRMARRPASLSVLRRGWRHSPSTTQIWSSRVPADVLRILVPRLSRRAAPSFPYRKHSALTS
jgi:2,4-dienoyl-CoA reductase-like NADH-dependent reductase (Old Yellow Enzyme family)